LLRVKTADCAPDFVALRIEEDEGGRELKPVGGRKFPADGFLDVQADDFDFAAEFLFKPVNGGF